MTVLIMLLVFSPGKDTLAVRIFQGGQYASPA